MTYLGPTTPVTTVTDFAFHGKLEGTNRYVGPLLASAEGNKITSLCSLWPFVSFVICSSNLRNFDKNPKHQQQQNLKIKTNHKSKNL